MKLLRLANHRFAVLATAFLGCVSARAQPTSLEPVELPASVRPLPEFAESSAAGADAPARADTEEVVVRGRSMSFLHEQLELAEDRLYSVYNDINTIEEFDIHCRMHAQTGTRMPQRLCLPNYAALPDERRAAAVLRVLGGESSYELDWQSPHAEMSYKTTELEAHMQQLAADHPELLEAMAELYGLMKTLYPRRYDLEGER